VATTIVFIAVALMGLASPLLLLVPGASAGVAMAFGVVWAAIGLVVGLRSPRVGVTLTHDQLRYVGFLRTTTIPRRAITAVTDDATVEWMPDPGLGRSTALGIFRPAYEDDGTVFARSWVWRRQGLERVQRWAEGDLLPSSTS